MRLDLIVVPYHMGIAHSGPGNGPDRLLQAGLPDRLAALGHQVTVRRVLRGATHADALAAIADVNTVLAGMVREALAAGRFPLVLAGNCNSALGTLTGLDVRDLGAVWFDAHGDFNTPRTSPSGNFEGMPLAVAAGRCHEEMWYAMGNTARLIEQRIVLAGVRDLDPLEAELLKQTQVTVLPADHLQAGGLAAGLPPALDKLRKETASIYLHLDVDALSVEFAPGTDYHVPDGLSLDGLREAIRLIRERFTIRAAALTNFNSAREQHNMTVNSALALAEAVVA